MEEIINHLYSDRNLTKLTEKLAELVDDFGNTEEARNYCKLWLKRKMKTTLENSRDQFRGDKKEVINRIARDKIYPGEAIVEGKLAPVGSKAGMEAMISVGKRAITVRVNDIVGVAGFALPGSYVDILANIHDASNQPYSKVVLNRVKVLAVAQDTATDPSKPKVVNAVTLELTPAEAEKLDLVRTVGSLSLVLRNEMDNTTNTSSGARVNDLMSNHETSEAVKLDNIPSRINQLDDGRGDLKGKIANKPVNPIPSEGYGRVEEIRGLNRSKTQDSPN